MMQQKVEQATPDRRANSVSQAVSQWARQEIIALKDNEEDLIKQGQEADTLTQAIINKEMARMCRNMANQLKFSRQGFEDGVSLRSHNPPNMDPGKTAYAKAYERGESVRNRLDRQGTPVEKAIYTQELIQALTNGQPSL